MINSLGSKSNNELLSTKNKLVYIVGGNEGDEVRTCPETSNPFDHF